MWECRICLEDRFLTIAIVAQGPEHTRPETVLSDNGSLDLVDKQKRKRKATTSAGNYESLALKDLAAPLRMIQYHQPTWLYAIATPHVWATPRTRLQ